MLVLAGMVHRRKYAQMGLRPRQGPARLARGVCPLWPAACSERVGTQDAPACGALYPASTGPWQRCTHPVPEAHA